jgi:hypothetical protein
LVAYDDDVWRRRAAGWHDRCTHYYTRPFKAGETTSPQDKLNGAKRYFRTNQEFNKQLNLTSSYKRLSSFPIRTFIGRVAQDLPYLNIRLAPTASYNGLASIKLGRNGNEAHDSQLQLARSLRPRPVLKLPSANREVVIF